MSLMVTFPVTVFLIETFPSEDFTATKSSPRRRPSSVALSTMRSSLDEQLVMIGGMAMRPITDHATAAMLSFTKVFINILNLLLMCLFSGYEIPPYLPNNQVIFFAMYDLNL